MKRVQMATKDLQLAAEQERTILRGGIAVVLSALLLISGAHFLPQLVTFPHGPIDSIIFAGRLSLVPGLVLLFAVRLVASVRFRSAEDNRGAAYAPPSQKLAFPAAFLQNTLEQTVLAVIANFALASIGSVSATAYMAVGAALFLIGRIAFFFGYRRGAGARSFGMVMTMMPALGVFVWVPIALIM